MTYPTFLRLPLAALGCAMGAAAFAPAAAQQALSLAPESKLWFDGKSTVRDWSCKAPVMQATLTLAEAATAAVLAGDEPQASTTFIVPTMKLDCDNGTMNNHMRKAIAAEKFGEITFALKAYEAIPEAGAATKGTLRGDLTIKGVTKEVALPVEFVAAGASGLRVKGKYELKMTDWGVEPPKLMMGTMKVREMVTIGFDLLLQ
jgi:polyisoprenoid-binding protein YceI